VRRTFASLLFALGASLPYVMAQMGHTTANLTLAIHARHRIAASGESERLIALLNGSIVEAKGTGASVEGASAKKSLTSAEPELTG
jgi:hypothetical protein